MSLNLSRNVIKAKDMEQVARALAQCSAVTSALTHLDMCFDRIGDDVGPLAAPRLLDLGKNGIGPGGSGRLGRALIQHASAITHPGLAGNQLRAQGADMLASAIGQYPSLPVSIRHCKYHLIQSDGDRAHWRLCGGYKIVYQ